jgi:hypothetical protein
MKTWRGVEAEFHPHILDREFATFSTPAGTFSLAYALGGYKVINGDSVLKWLLS